jgi:hypothetical protein
VLSRLAAVKTATWVLTGVVVAIGGAGVALLATQGTQPKSRSVIATSPTSETSTTAKAPTSRSSTISWLAAGDSYASGAGLTRTTEPCADAAGTAAAPSKAWAIVASQSPLLAGEHFGAPDLVACTGAETGEFFSPQGHDPAEWTPSMGPFDLVTFSFGGDNIGFPSVVSGPRGRPNAPHQPGVKCRTRMPSPIR